MSGQHRGKICRHTCQNDKNLKIIAKRSSLLFPQFREALADVANVNIEKGADKGKVDRARGELFRPERDDLVRLCCYLITL